MYIYMKLASFVNINSNTTCYYYRKQAINLLKTCKRFTKPRTKKQGKPTAYQNESILKSHNYICFSANLPCSELSIRIRIDLHYPALFCSFRLSSL